MCVKVKNEELTVENISHAWTVVKLDRTCSHTVIQSHGDEAAIYKSSLLYIILSNGAHM